MGFKDKLYLASPIFLQQIMVATYGVWWYYRRFGRKFQQNVAEIEGRDYWSNEQWRTYQNQRLLEIVDVAGNAVHYRNAFQKAGIKQNEINIDTIHRLPFLERNILRQFPEDLLTRKPPRGTVMEHTSGTTGTPAKVYYTRDFHPLEMAFHEARCKNWAGVTYKDRRAMFSVRKVCRFEQDFPPFWRISPIENMAYFSIYHLSAAFIPTYIHFLNHYRPKVVMGVPSALGTLARFSLEEGMPLAPVQAVISNAEILTADTRAALEQAWNCRVSDMYGTVEQCVYATQCEYGKMHVSPDVGIVEIVDGEGNPCQPGEVGEIVSTGLLNELQPLIRYRLGDVASWSNDQSCPCGRKMPVLDSVQGRFEDMCFTKDGRAITRFSVMFKGMVTIKEAQVIQEAVDRFTVVIVPSSGFGEDEVDLIHRRAKNIIGDAQITVQVVDQIPRTKSGKFKAVISRLTLEERSQLWKSATPKKQDE